MSDGMSDTDRGTYSFSGPLKTAEPGRRPRRHRASARRDQARDQWLEALRDPMITPWVAKRLSTDAFLQRARAEDYEALVALIKDLR